MLRNAVEFMGTVPQTPNRLRGINEKDSIVYMAGRDKFSRVRVELAKIYKIDEFKVASELFKKSGVIFKELCDIFISYVLDEECDMSIASKLLIEAYDIELDAYSKILEGVEKL